MQQSEVIKTVKSTAPILAAEGENITKLFYQKLFVNHPELQNTFNMANQAQNAQGQGEQARALAQSVFKYASYIDQLDELGPMVKRIAHKHASLAVAPEHYPIVGKYLLEAISEHLQIPPQDPVIQAWAIAYGQLAEIFVSTEEQIYTDNSNKDGGWRGFRSFTISNIVAEAQDIKSFYLRAEDGEPIASFDAGQYVGVKIETPEGEYDHIRQYSLSAAPGEDYYRITVKSEANHAQHPGQVSNYLHTLNVGDSVFLQPPTGEFVIENQDSNIVLIAGGVGITPLLSMLLNLIQQGVPAEKITFIQCCRDSNHHIMKHALEQLASQTGFTYKVAYELSEGADHKGYLTSDTLEKWLPDLSADVYFCGPRPFMGALNNMLQTVGFKESQLHHEVFGPNTGLN